MRDDIKAALAACDVCRSAMVPGTTYEVVFLAMENAMRATLLALQTAEATNSKEAPHA